MKKEAGVVDAIPSKRLFLSIIADYDLNRALCELIDNALDIWIKTGRRGNVEVKIELNEDQQTIRVTDNAGGVPRVDLRYIVGPGQTGNLPTDRTIGIFGVGTKRAVVALAQEVKVVTRHNKNSTYQIQFDEAWLSDDENWELPVSEVDQIQEGTTIIELQKLRRKITADAISSLKEHLQVTYARFLRKKKVRIELNGERLEPIDFERWAFPPRFPPHQYMGKVETEDGDTVAVDVLAGLTTESSPAGGEYGVYFYCNDRLIARGLKSYDVGFTKGLAGLPHPSVSLVRIIVSLNGGAQSMPWNSSKSGINPNHPVFIAIRGLLVEVVKDFASLSRRLEGHWPERVFRYTKGSTKKIEVQNLPEARKSYLPQLPKSRPRYGDRIRQANRRIAKDKPWIVGLYESVVAVDLIFRQKLQQKNRICLILLDSTLEIALKEYLVNESGQPYSDARLASLFSNRSDVQKEVQKHINLSQKIWKKIDHYYRLRCKLVHERASGGVTDEQIEDYRETIQVVLSRLFRLKFE